MFVEKSRMFPLCYLKLVYDRNGNRVSGNDNGKEFKALFDPQDRLIKFNDTTYTYNANGFLSQKFSPGVGATTYTYDSLGNLKRVQLPNNDLNYEVDALGRRVVVKQYGNNFKTRYVWDGKLRIIAELGAGGNRVKKYVYAEGVNSPEYMEYLGRKYQFIKDHRGSVSLVVDSESGEVKQKLRYSEWGEVIEDTNPGFRPFGFAGGLYDNISKLYRFGVRDYDPEIGRWLSKDPIRFDGGDTNLYGYVLQDPINFIVPKGKGAEGAFGWAFMLAGGMGALVNPGIGLCTMAVGAAMIIHDRQESNKKLQGTEASKESEPDAEESETNPSIPGPA